MRVVNHTKIPVSFSSPLQCCVLAASQSKISPRTFQHWLGVRVQGVGVGG